MCTPIACHIHMHVCANLLRVAGTQWVLNCFCAEILYFWIVMDYSTFHSCSPSAACRLQCFWKNPWRGSLIICYGSFLSSFLVKIGKKALTQAFWIISIIHSHCFPCSHRRPDQTLSLTLTGCQQKIAALEQVDPAHRSVLLFSEVSNHPGLNSAPLAFFYQHSKQ